MNAIELDAPIDLAGNIHLPEHFSYLYGQRARVVIMWPSEEPSELMSSREKVAWPEIEPQRDLASLIGKSVLLEDGVAYQRRIRDGEWS